MDPHTIPNPDLPGVAVFDLDGTLVGIDTYVAYLLGFLKLHPTRWGRTLPLPGAVAMHLARWRDNTWLKVTFLKSILGGLSRCTLAEWSEMFAERLLTREIRGDGLRAIEQRRAAGDRLLLATASLDLYVAPLAERLGFDDVICTRVMWDEAERISGGLDGGNCYGAEKLTRVLHWLAATGIDGPMWVFTDHHSDLPLLRRADWPVAVCPTPPLQAVAIKSSIPIEDWR